MARADSPLQKPLPRAVLALVLGAGHAFTFAPLNLWWLQLLVLTGLAALLLPPAGVPRSTRSREVWRAAGIGLLFGVGWFVAGLYWLTISMHTYGGMPRLLAWGALLLFALYLSLFPALASALAVRFGRHANGTLAPWRTLIALAGAMTLTEWLRGWLFTGFPWLSFGYAQIDGPLAGWAPMGGVLATGLGAWLAAGALALALSRSLSRPPVRLGMLLLATLTAVVGTLLTRVIWSEPVGEPIRIRLVQGNIPQNLKFDPLQELNAQVRHVDLATAGPADLVILPETAWTQPLASTPPELLERLYRYINAEQAAVAIGLPLYGPGRDMAGRLLPTNSVEVLDPQSLGATARTPYRYDKHHLVPFGEFVPFGFRWFVDAMKIPLGDFSAGPVQQEPYALGRQRIAFNICYEDLFGSELLTALRGDDSATILANVSNIAWFGQSTAPAQHLQIARMRAIETSRPMVRATNTGTTAAIDFDGKVLRTMPTFESGSLTVTIQGRRGLTPYAVVGDTPVLLISAALCLFAGGWRRRAARRNG